MLRESPDTSSRSVESSDRRQHDRLPLPAEIVLAWHHEPETPVRYTLVDAGDGGLRITSRHPLLHGMTGIVLRLLPEGTSVNRSIMVAWCRQRDHVGYELGLRFF